VLFSWQNRPIAILWIEHWFGLSFEMVKHPPPLLGLDDHVTSRAGGQAWATDRPAKLKYKPLPKDKMFDKTGHWIHLSTFDDFDNGLSDLIDLWSSTSKTATKAVKDSALAHFEEDLEAAVLKWIDNKAKSKKYASIGEELAEFEEVLKEGSGFAIEVENTAPSLPNKAKKKE
jgi:hypothetical protein